MCTIGGATPLNLAFPQPVGSVTQGQSTGDFAALKGLLNDQNTYIAQAQGAPQDMGAMFSNFIKLFVSYIEKMFPGSAAGGATAQLSKPTSFKSAGPALAGMSNEFLWKPSSDKDGRLVTLLPANMSAQAKSATIVSPNGKVIEKGDDAGYGNGGRRHFRFDKGGSSYPAGSKLVVTMRDGQTWEMTIKNPGSRIEKRI